jgi:hypothetical protein
MIHGLRNHPKTVKDLFRSREAHDSERVLGLLVFVGCDHPALAGAATRRQAITPGFQGFAAPDEMNNSIP